MYEMEAEDLLNESIMKLLANIVDTKYDCQQLYNPEAYVYNAINNNAQRVFLSTKKSWKARHRRNESYVQNIEKPIQMDREERIVCNVERRFDQSLLSDVDHAIIRLRKEGASYQDIMDKFDMSQKQLYRYLDKLKDKIKEGELI